MSERRAPAACANCGTAIPPRALSCPECGADERTGWRETDATRYDGLDLPDSAFADDDSKTDSSRRPLSRGLAWYWYLAAALVLLSLILGVVRFR